MQFNVVSEKYVPLVIFSAFNGRIKLTIYKKTSSPEVKRKLEKWGNNGCFHYVYYGMEQYW